jgi:hypothetical protein
VLVPWCSVNGVCLYFSASDTKHASVVADELAHGLNEEATGDDQQQTRVSSAVDVRVCALCVRMLAIDMYTHVSAGDWRRVRRVLDALTVQDITTQSSSSTASTAVVHENGTNSLFIGGRGSLVLFIPKRIQLWESGI